MVGGESATLATQGQSEVGAFPVIFQIMTYVNHVLKKTAETKLFVASEKVKQEPFYFNLELFRTLALKETRLIGCGAVG